MNSVYRTFPLLKLMTYFSVFDMVHTVQHVLHFPLYTSCRTLHCVRPLTYSFLLLRISVFINTIFRELQSNYSCFTAQQMLLEVGSQLPEDCVNKHRNA